MSLAEFFSEHKEMIDGKKRDCRGNAVRIDEKWGYFDVETKQVIIKPRFDEAFMFSDGRGRVIMKSINPDDGISELEQYGFIDEKGDFVVRPSYPYARDFSSGLAVVVNDNDLWGYINTNGEEVIPCQFEDADDFDGAYAAVCNKGVAGRIDKKGVFTPDSLAHEENLALLPDKELMLKLIDLYEDALTNGRISICFELIEDLLGIKKLPFIYMMRADLYMELGKNRNAVNDITSAIELGEQSADAFHKRAYLYMHTRRFRKAISDAQKAITLEPENEELYNIIGLSLLFSNKPGQALEYFLQAAKINPDEGNYWLSAADACMLLERADDAKEYYHKAATCGSREAKQKLQSL